jgi:2-oxoglutarate ferredoxin oxidoreductase subunit alpha
MKNFTFKIGGEAGFGIATSGLIFSKIATRLGYHVFDYLEYPSLVRGGHNAYEVNVGQEEITSLKKEIDLLVCLNKETFEKHKHRLTNESFIIFDREEFDFDDNFKKISVPFGKILNELKGQTVMKNTIALGAVFGILSAPIEEFLKVIEEQFFKKGEAVIKFNQEFAKRGYDFILENYKSEVVDWLKRKENFEQQLVVSGNEAFSLASVVADCRLYCAYPMTPSSSVLHTLASWQEKTGMIVRHAEDEIAVINTALGASFAGVRAAVGTSGGGFALMVESVSLAGVTETPLVIFIAQRPGPATGMPTWTEQGDLLFACFAGHGEFPRIVLAPGDQQEMIELTLKAFNLADIYQLPVIILSDMYLSEGHKSISLKWLEEVIKGYDINRGKIMQNSKAKDQNNNEGLKSENFLRYKITEDGISERILPGTDGFFYQANSYEHLENGHTTEESQPRKDQVNKRNKKWQTYFAKDFNLPKFYGDNEADIIFISWGSTKGIILEAQKQLQQKNIKTGFYHFNHLYPLDKEKIKNLFVSGKRYILVENNSWGQFGKILTMETGIEIKEKILRYDGRPIEVEEIVQIIQHLTFENLK